MAVVGPGIRYKMAVPVSVRFESRGARHAQAHSRAGSEILKGQLPDVENCRILREITPGR